ncbi:TPA: hypothetical protein QB634_002162, partial [Pasteurella multocida]|nr:hypothetical protein [Pasteurella multocida]
KGIDANLVKRSLIDLSERHWNDSYDPLKEANVSRLISLLDEFELKHNFIESDINTKKNLLSTTDTVEKVTGLSSLEKDDELQKYIKEKRDLT